MSTVFFLPSSGSAAVSPTPSGTDWAHINGVSRPLRSSIGNSSFATTTYAPDGPGSHDVDANALVAQFVSDVQPAGIIPAQYIGLWVKAVEETSAGNLSVTWKFYAVNTAGSTLLGTLLSIGRMATEVSTGLGGNSEVRTCAELDLSAQDYRLVLEVGLGGMPSGGTHNGGMEFGDPTFANQMNLDDYGFLLMTGSRATSGKHPRGFAI